MTDKPKTTLRYLYPQGFEPLEQRSVGDVPAPTPDDELEATLATSVERTAVCKFLVRMAHDCPVYGGQFLRDAAYAIERGEHTK
jgi:hypothetical protein